MKDVDTFVKLNKAPQSGIVKGYKFFCEGFIKDYDGKSLISAVFAVMGKLAKPGVEFLSRYLPTGRLFIKLVKEKKMTLFLSEQDVSSR